MTTLDRSTRWVSALVLAGAIALAATPAAAQEARAIVLGFSGPGASAAESEVRRTIEDGESWAVVDGAAVDRASVRLGRGPGSREVAAEVGASAVIEGRVARRGRRFVLRLSVRDAASGSTLAEESFAGRGAPGLRADVRRTFWDGAGAAMARGRVPTVIDTTSASASTSAQPSRARRAEPAGQETVPESPIASVAPGAPSPLWVAIGASVFSRDFSYTDDLYLALRPYQLPVGFAMRAAVRWYPGAHVTRDFAANVGLDVAVGGALGLRSRQRDGTTFPTESVDFRAGADVRIPLAPIELGLGLGYGVHTFALGAADDGNAASLPNVEYQFVRPAVRARGDLGAGLYVEGSFGWRILTASGGLAAWFPRNTGSGFDLGAHVGWESDLGIGMRAGFELQRYFFSMSPEPGDEHVAGGAADQFLVGSLDLVYRMQ